MNEYDGYVLLEYELFKAKVLKENKKTFTVFTDGEQRRIAKEKYVPKDIPFCVVWERWKGVNGRGGYRLETNKYPAQHRVGLRRTTDYVSEETP